MKTVRVPSSKAGFSYDVLIHDNGDITCPCLGFTNRRKCRHVDNVRGQSAEPSVPDIPAAPTSSLFEEPTGFVDPMLASHLKEGLSLEDFSADYVMEQKFNGHRLILLNTPDGPFGWSRQGTPRALPGHIVRACSRLAFGVYDSELVSVTGFHTDVKAREHQEGLRVMLFDILNIMLFDTHNRPMGLTTVQHEPQTARREYLVTACSKLAHPDVELAYQYPVSRDQLHSIWNAGGEGVIIKRRTGRYTPGKRSKDWIKVKKLEPAVITVTEFLAGELGPHSRIRGRDTHGVEVTVKSLNDEWRANFAVNAARYIGRSLVVEHRGRTRDGKYVSAMADHWENE